MTASYTNTDRFNKSSRALTFPVMIPSTCSTCYSPLQNFSSSRLTPEHYSSTCYSPLQNLSSSRLIPEHYSSTCYSPLQNLSSSRLIPEHYSSTCYSSLQNLPHLIYVEHYRVTASYFERERFDH